jgi:hypothetical protein
VYQAPYFYNAYCHYKNSEKDTTGYTQIANSFINSFSIVNTNEYWILKLMNTQNSVSSNGTLYRESLGTCYERGPDVQRSFYRGPFFSDDGSMFLAYDNLVHTDSLRYKDILLLNDQLHSHRPSQAGQGYYIPASGLPKQKYKLDLGYLLHEDSTEACYELYHESIEIDPSSQIVTPAF